MPTHRASRGRARAARGSKHQPPPLHPDDVVLNDALNARQRAFCLSYSVFGNAARAAAEAGYTTKAAKEAGYQLLTNIHVRAEVERLQRLRAARYELTADNLKRRAAQWAFTDVDELFYPGTNTLKPIAEMSADAIALISGLEHGYTTERRGRKGNQRTREAIVKVKAVDRIAAAELLARLMGVLKDAGVAPPYTGASFILPQGTKVRIE